VNPFKRHLAGGGLRFAATWSAADKAYFTRFFARPAGRLYLTDILDGATCKGQLKTVNAPPLPPLAGADKARWEALLAAHDGGAARFTARLNALSPEEQQSFAAGYKKLGQAFEQAQGKMSAAQDAALLKRITHATQPHRADILKLAGAR